MPLQIARGAVDQTGTDLAAICESANAKRTSGGWAALSYSCFDNLLELDLSKRLYEAGLRAVFADDLFQVGTRHENGRCAEISMRR